LPTVGAAESERSEDEPGEIVPAEARDTLPFRAVVVAGAVSTAPVSTFAERLAHALVRRGITGAGLVVTPAERTSVQTGDFVERSTPDRMVAAGLAPVRWLALEPARRRHGLSQVVQDFTGAGTLVATGLDLAAVYEPWLTVLLTAGVTEPSWRRTARALRDRMDLMLADPRPGVAEELAARVAHLHEDG
jgi:hypothetical protein